MMASSNLSPPTRTLPLYTMPPSEITPTSVVPPPMSTTIEPQASDTGRPAPMPAALGSPIRDTARGAGADAGRDRLLDQVHGRGACGHGGVLDRAALDLGGAAGHADDDARAGGEQRARVHHLDELLDHLLGDDEVGDHAVLHRRDGLDIAGHLAQHRLGLAAHGLYHLLAMGAALVADRDHRRFIEHNAFVAGEDQGIGSAKVNRKISREIPTESSEHSGILSG